MYPVMWPICFLVLAFAMEASSRLSVNSSSPNLGTQKQLVIFQFLDESFLPIWHNWISLALHFEVFDLHTEYHLSCFGSPQLDTKVKLLYSAGCSSRYSSTPETYKRVYLAKWTAFVRAFEEVQGDVLLVDLDALLLRPPRPTFSSTGPFHIISSADHGHARKNFPYSHNWGDIRLCTGFIFFRQSRQISELLRVVLEYLTEYGQGDQIAFNNVLAQYGVLWQAAPSSQDGQIGLLLWSNQSDASLPRHKYVSDFATQKTRSVEAVAGALRVKLLPHHTVMRYCDKKGDLSYDNRPSQYVALHCYDSTRVPSAGIRRAHLKAFTFQKMRLWVLKRQYTPSHSHSLLEPGSEQSILEAPEPQPRARASGKSSRGEKKPGAGGKRRAGKRKKPLVFANPVDPSRSVRQSSAKHRQLATTRAGGERHGDVVMKTYTRDEEGTEVPGVVASFRLDVVRSMVNTSSLQRMVHLWKVATL